MILLSIEINCLRGIKNLKLDFKGENAVIYGDNGTGKSGVIDAIDFLIKGDITRLSGTGSKQLSLDRHGKYVTENISNSWVKAIVKLPNYKEKIVITRFLKNPNQLVCDSKYEEDFQKINDLSRLQAHYLSRREILQFINSTEQERAKNIEKLLNLFSLEKNRAILQKIKKQTEEELKLSEKQEETYIKQISEKLSIDKNSWLDIINEIRFQLGADPIVKLDAEEIVSNLSLTKSTIPKTEITSLIQKISEVSNEEEKLVAQIKTVKSSYEKILLTKEYENCIDSIILYEKGKELIKSNICPLCGQTIEDKTKLIDSLQEKLDKLNDTKISSDEYKKSIKILEQTLTILKQQLDSINFDSLSTFLDNKKLQDFRNGIDGFYNSIQKNEFSSELAQSFLDKNYEKVLKQYYFDELCKQSATMSLDQKERNYNILINVSSIYGLLTEAENKTALLRTHCKRATLLFNEYVKAQTEVLNEMYDSIQERFSQLYKIIHESDESAFSSAFNRKASSLELQVKFKDGNMYPPNAVHSEGHQDSMGICLFFALSEKISNCQLNIILLDDVVMSIDIDHRKNFCKLLKEQFPEKQFFITTHDYIWRKELETQGVVKKSNVIHFKFWDIEHGPYVETGSNIWDTINNYLLKGEKNEAIGLMRYHMEEFFSDLCAQYRLKVPYSVAGRWSLEDVLSPVLQYYRKAIKSAKESAEFFNKPIDKIVAYEKKFNDATNRLQTDRWTINPSTHFTVWAQSLSVSELKSTCLAVKELCDIFECPNCKSLIKVESGENLSPLFISCNCGDFNYSCKKNK